MLTDPKDLENLSERDLRVTVLMPLLQKMGYRDVFEWHGGPGELGKDIVAWKENELGRRRYTAVVAKTNRMSTNAQIHDVVTQVAQVFGHPVRNQITGEEHHVAECWVITNKRLGKEARERVRAALAVPIPSAAEIIDRNDLWERMSKYIPLDIHDATEHVSSYLDRLELGYDVSVQIGDSDRTFMRISNDEKSFFIREACPNQLETEPVEINAEVVFPDTLEGRKKLKELEASMLFGGSVEIPGYYVQVRFSDALEKVIHELTGWLPTEFARITVANPKDPKQFPVTIAVTCDDGDSAVLDYIVWKHHEGDLDDLTFTNEEQPFPIKVRGRFNSHSHRFTIDLSLSGDVIAAPVLKNFYLFLKCLSKPCDIRVILNETGASLGRMRNDEVTSGLAEDHGISFASVLCDVQERTGVPLFVPFRLFTDKEQEAIALLHHVVKGGTARGTWNNVSVNVLPVGVQENLEQFTKYNPVSIRLEQEATLELFGATIPLGRVRYTMSQARLANEAEIRAWLSNPHPETEDVEFKLVPGEDDAVREEFIDWSLNSRTT